MKKLICREQFYIDTLNPQYNILQTAGSSTGFKHSDITKKKISESMKGVNLGRKQSDEARANNSAAKKGVNHPLFGKVAYVAIPFYVYTKDNELYGEFPSRKAVADHFNVSSTTIGNYVKSKKLFKDNYFISKIKIEIFFRF